MKQKVSEEIFKIYYLNELIKHKFELSSISISFMDSYD